MVIMYKKIKIKLICECTVICYSLMMAIEIHYVIIMSVFVSNRLTTLVVMPFQQNNINRTDNNSEVLWHTDMVIRAVAAIESTEALSLVHFQWILASLHSPKQGTLQGDSSQAYKLGFFWEILNVIKIKRIFFYPP